MSALEDCLAMGYPDLGGCLIVERVQSLKVSKLAYVLGWKSVWIVKVSGLVLVSLSSESKLLGQFECCASIMASSTIATRYFTTSANYHMAKRLKTDADV